MPQSKMNIESYVENLAKTVLPDTGPAAEPETVSLESVLKGLVVELWSDAAGCFFIVANEEDATKTRKPRGNIYTAAEVRRVVQIDDPVVVREIHEWKRRFDGRIRDVQQSEPKKRTRGPVASDGGGGACLKWDCHRERGIAPAI